MCCATLTTLTVTSQSHELPGVGNGETPLTSGIDANPGMYNRLAQRAGQGFAVTIPSEWFNSPACVPAAPARPWRAGRTRM